MATIDVGAPQPLERYYHHLFTTDMHIAALYEELGMANGIEWRPSSVAMFANGRSYPFVSPLDLLRYKPLAPLDRLRLGWGVIKILRGSGDVGPFERDTARAWIEREMGTKVWDGVWGPLLRGKFEEHASEISMAWLWARITARRRLGGNGPNKEMLGYPCGSWQPLLDNLRNEIEAGGGRVLIDCPAASVTRRNGRYEVVAGAPGSWRRGHDPRQFKRRPDAEDYDRVVATVPNATSSNSSTMNSERHSRPATSTAPSGRIQRGTVPPARAGSASNRVLLDERRRPGDPLSGDRRADQSHRAGAVWGKAVCLRGKLCESRRPAPALDRRAAPGRIRARNSPRESLVLTQLG